MTMIELSNPIACKARSVCTVIRLHDKEAWLVGGAIRDLLMGNVPHDYDVATNATPAEITSWFGHVIPTGIKHGTVTVMIGDDAFEVTTFRGESTYSDGRHPDSVHVVQTIQEDLSRRDFTINAIAYDPVDDVFCDPFGGCADILLELIRCVGNPDERFSEDGLRCLRACRFSATLGFEIETETFRAIKRHLDTYEQVSVERIVSEFRKALKADRPSIAFWAMAKSGILSTTIPEFASSYGFQQNKWHAYDVFTHVMHVLDAASKDELVQFGALFHDISKPDCYAPHKVTGDATFYNHEDRGAEVTREIMTRLKFSSAEIDVVSHLVKHHLLPHDERLSGAALRRWVIKVGAEHVDRILDLAQADLEGKGPAVNQMPADFVKRFRERIAFQATKAPIVSKTGQLALNGKDIMAICDLKPGPEVGFLLMKCLEFVTDDPDRNTRDALTSFLQTETLVT